MYIGFLHMHSFLRYVIVVLVLATFVKAVLGWIGNKSFGKGDEKLVLFTMIFAHVQLLVGLGLYFVSPTVDTALASFGDAMKDPVLRFWSMEHALLMVLAIAMLTAARITVKKVQDDKTRFFRVSMLYLMVIVDFLFAIPFDRWP